MKGLQQTLKVLHVLVAGLAIAVSVIAQDQLSGQFTPGSGDNAVNYSTRGFDKDAFVSSAFLISIFAITQICLLFFFHDYKGTETHFKLAYFIVAVLSIIFGSILLQGAVTLYNDGTNEGNSFNEALDKYRNFARGGGLALAVVVLLFNFVNLYHAGYAVLDRGSRKMSPKKGEMKTPITLSRRKRK